MFGGVFLVEWLHSPHSWFNIISAVFNVVFVIITVPSLPKLSLGLAGYDKVGAQTQKESTPYGKNRNNVPYLFQEDGEYTEI